MRTIYSILIFLGLAIGGFAQAPAPCSHEVKGVILDSKTKKPLPFVAVVVKGANQHTITDRNGMFNIKGICDIKNDLEISCMGYCKKNCSISPFQGKASKIYLDEEVYTLGSVSVIAEKKKVQGTETMSQLTMKKDALSGNLTQSLAATLSKVEGVAFASTGSNVQLPIIHGLYGNRILILNNGLKHGFQNWGTDHAPEIDVASANSITVVKGAAGVRYGPEALGGAIVIESAPLILNKPLEVGVGTGFETNGKGYFANAGIKKGYKNWSYQIGANLTRIGDRHAPDYNLTNSGKKENSINAGLRYKYKKWDFKTYYSYVKQDLGILLASTGQSDIHALIRAMNSKKPDSSYIKPFSYDINQPYQATEHHLGKFEVKWRYSDEANLVLRVGSQLNKRNEYELRRNRDRPVIDLDLITNDYQLEWKHPKWFDLNGLVGLQMFMQNNDNNPGTNRTPYIPNYNSRRYSAFVTESFIRNNNTIEAGVRIDYEYNNARGRQHDAKIFRHQYSFANITSSLGFIHRFTAQNTFRTNVGIAWRTPNMSELYAFGKHGTEIKFGSLRYEWNDERGRPDTNEVFEIEKQGSSPERGYKWINEFHIQENDNTFNTTFYLNYIENFIFDRPYGFTKTAAGPFPAYVFVQADALFIGIDATWKRKWSDSFNGNFGLSYLWSRNIEKDEPLINQPPFKTSYELIWNVKDYWKLKSSRLSIKPSYTARQFQAPRTVPPEDIRDKIADISLESEIFDFKDAPDGYFLMDIAYKINIGDFESSFSVKNIFNTRYRDYLNEMRYYADNPGRNFLFSIKYTFKSNK